MGCSPSKSSGSSEPVKANRDVPAPASATMQVSGATPKSRDVSISSSQKKGDSSKEASAVASPNPHIDISKKPIVHPSSSNPHSETVENALAVAASPNPRRDKEERSRASSSNEEIIDVEDYDDDCENSPAPIAAVPPSSSSKVVAQFEILHELGRGGCAKVKLCRATDTGIEYAIKIFNRKTLEKQKERKGKVIIETGMDKVKREIAIMKKLQHKNIVRLQQVVDDGNTAKLYVVMEFIPGGQVMHWSAALNAYSVVKQGSSPPANDPSVISRAFNSNEGFVYSESRSRRYFIQLLEALQYLHHQGILHRDVKPENIMLGAGDEIKLTDFGISFVEDGKKEMNVTEGTRMFQSPEVIQGDASMVGGGSDLWAAAVTLFSMLFGELPFQGETPFACMEAIEEGRYTVPSDGQKDVELCDLFSKIFVVDPSQRLGVVDILRHPWTLRDGSVRPQQLGGVITVTQDEVFSAVGNIQNFFLLTKIKIKASMWRSRSRKAASLGAALKNDAAMQDIVDGAITDSAAFPMKSASTGSVDVPSAIGEDGDDDDPDSEAHEIQDTKSNTTLSPKTSRVVIDSYRNNKFVPPTSSN